MTLSLFAAKIYGWQHFTFLAIYFVAFAASLVFVKLKVKSEKTIDIIVKALGGALLAFILFNRIAICFHRETAWGLVPDSFCGVGSLCLALTCLFFKRGALPYHAFVYWMFFGGLITVFYPDFIGQQYHGEATAFMYPATISGMLHHALACYITVFLCVTGHFKPCVKKTYALPIMICFTLVYGIFLMDACGFDHAMYINKPLVPNTFITWYVVEPALVAVSYGFAFLYEYLVKKKSEKTATPPEPADSEAELPPSENQ